LREIIESDRWAVEKLGTTSRAIAKVLAEALSKAMSAYGTAVRIGEHLVAEAYEARGKIPSPFGDGVYPKGQVKITDSRSGKSILISPLSVHMIEAQGFFGGEGSRYRIEPAEICRMFPIGSPHQGQ